MTTPHTIPFDEIAFSPEMADIARRIYDSPDMNLYVPEAHNRHMRKLTYAYAEREGNLGYVEYCTYPPFGYRVSFPIRPSRRWGSSVIIATDAITDDDVYLNIDDVRAALDKACQPTMMLPHWYDKDAGRVVTNYGLSARTAPHNALMRVI